MKKLTDFRDITERKVFPVTHYCVKNAREENIEVPKGQHDFEVIDDYIWYSTKRLNEKNIVIKSAKEQFVEFVRDNLDSIMAGTFISEDDIYPQAKLEFEILKEYCKSIGTTINIKFPILLSKISKMASNYQAAKRKWLQYLHSWSISPIFDEELKDKIDSYGN